MHSSARSEAQSGSVSRARPHSSGLGERVSCQPATSAGGEQLHGGRHAGAAAGIRPARVSDRPPIGQQDGAEGPVRPAAPLPASAQKDTGEYAAWREWRPRGKRKRPPLPRPHPLVGSIAAREDEEVVSRVQVQRARTLLRCGREAAGRDLNRVEGQMPRAPWAAGLSNPWLRISFFLSKRVEVTVFLSQLMNRFWVAGVTIETGAILSK